MDEEKYAASAGRKHPVNLCRARMRDKPESGAARLAAGALALLVAAAMALPVRAATSEEVLSL